MQDAQGRAIKDHGARTLEISACNTKGQTTVLREKFALANIGNVILSLGRLLRSGWRLTHDGTQQVVEKDGCALPVRLKRNTLVLKAVISAIAVYDSGALPPEMEEIIATPGWSILPSGLPVLVAHGVEEIPIDGDVWDPADWAAVAIFTKPHKAGAVPKNGDVWVQVRSMSIEEFIRIPRAIKDLDSELTGKHDIAILYHVAELEHDLLSNPREIFKEPAEGEDVIMPAEGDPDDDGGGAGQLLPDVWVDGRAVEEDGSGAEPVIDDVVLSVNTPLKQLRDLCQKLGLSKSGGKPKVLRRLKEHHEVMERQMATEIAKKVFAERDRVPDTIRVPALPSRRQQELHEITHQPFAAWCSACVMGRSRQSPHDKAKEDAKVEKDPHRPPVIQIDFCYTFTRPPGDCGDVGPETQAEAEKAGDEKIEEEVVAEKPDYKSQFGLNLVAAESTTGWILALPLVAKGTSTLKKVTEALVKMSIMIAGAEPIVIQGDPEPAIKQVLNAFEACRLKLNLRTEVRLAPSGSHASNGVAEKAVSTIRRHSLTLKAQLEERIQAEIAGHLPIYAWFLRHSSFVHNRFFVTDKGLPPYEIVNGRQFRAKMLPFGEQCIFCGSKNKGDVQWRKGVWVGLSEKSGAHVVMTQDGAFESRSVRRLPREQQWSAEAVVAAKGLPWDYKGALKRKKPLYVQSRGPLLPDTAALTELAKAAGVAAAESIAAGTPRPPIDEAGSDPPSPTSSSSTSSPSPSPMRGGIAPAENTAGGIAPAEDTASGIAPAEDTAGGIAPAEDTAGGIAPQSRVAGGDHPPCSVVTAGSEQMVVDTGLGDNRGRGTDGAGTSESRPKRARLLLDRPTVSPGGGSAQGLYPPGFAGVSVVHGDIEMASSRVQQAGRRRLVLS